MVNVPEDDDLSRLSNTPEAASILIIPECSFLLLKTELSSGPSLPNNWNSMKRMSVWYLVASQERSPSV